MIHDKCVSIVRNCVHLHWKLVFDSSRFSLLFIDERKSTNTQKKTKNSRAEKNAKKKITMSSDHKTESFVQFTKQLKAIKLGWGGKCKINANWHAKRKSYRTTER